MSGFATENDYDEFIDGPFADFERTSPVMFYGQDFPTIDEPELYDLALRWMLANVQSGARALIDPLPSPLADLGAAVALVAMLYPPRAATVRRDAPAVFHRDTWMPYSCMNATLFYRSGCDGGTLVMRERRIAFSARNRTMLVFDGQEEHGTTKLVLGRDGYRLSLTFYCPLP